MEYEKVVDEKLNIFKVNLLELLSSVRIEMRENGGRLRKTFSDEMSLFFHGTNQRL